MTKLFFAIGVFFVPTAVFAADATALLGGSGDGLVPMRGVEGYFYRACDLITLANNIINFGVAFSVIIATLMFAYAGILYVTAAGAGAEQVKKAHKVFTNIFVGLVFVLLAWLIVNILFSVLSGKGLAVWSQVDCISNPITDAFPHVNDRGIGGVTVGTGTNQGTVGAPVTSALPSTQLTNAAAVARLQAAGVCGGATPCLAGGTLQGINSKTIDQLILLHQASGCQFQVTSGVRGGASDPHHTGAKVDLRSTGNPCLNSFLEGISAPESHPNWSSTASAVVYRDACGNVYARETPLPGSGSGPHWDIQVVSLCRL